MTSITNALGAGADIDSKAVIADLAAAARKTRDQVLAAKVTSNSAKISGLAQIGAGLAEFADAFDTDAQDSTVATAKLINEFVVGFNQIRGLINSATVPGATPGTSGALLGDGGLRAVTSALSSLPSMVLAGGATARTLADLGISTNRNGTLTVNRVKMNAAIAADPVGVRAMLTAPGGLDTGLAKMRTAVLASGGPLDRSTARYTRMATVFTAAQEKVNTDNTKLIDRLITSFSLMDRQVALIKASQAYLTQQIAAWNSSDN